jgi:hypothetical protein
MKERGMHCELIPEYVKTLAWQDRKPVNFDQFYFFGKQSHWEARLAGKVDYVVTDAPSILSAYYTQVFGEPSTAAIFRAMALEFRRMMMAEDHSFLDIFLVRKSKYDPRGRFQTEQEALAIDSDLLSFLKSMKIDTTSVDADPQAAEYIISLLNKVNDRW